MENIRRIKIKKGFGPRAKRATGVKEAKSLSYKLGAIRAKLFHVKWLMFGLVLGVVLATVGSVAALNGWFGGGAAIPSDTMTRGLVGYWSMDGGSGTTTFDGSGNNNNGNFQTTASSPKWSSGKVGGALEFDGVDDYISVTRNSSIEPSTAISVEFWYKPNIISPNQRPIDKGVYGTNLGYQFSRNSSNALNFSIGDGTATKSGGANVVLTNGAWYHIIGTFDGQYVRLYINGVQETTVGDFGSVTAMSHNTSINLLIGGGESYDNAIIDEVRIYDRALSAEEVRYHYNRGGPVAEWKFDEGSGSTVYDSTDNNNDGTLVLAGSATSSAWVSGKQGTALRFDGADDYISVPTGTNLSTYTDGLTVSFWLKSDYATGTPISRWGTNNGYGLYTDNNWYMGNGAGWTYISAGRLSDNLWHYYILVWDKANMMSYRDGVFITSKAISNATFPSIAINMGRDNRGAGSYYLNGFLDDVRIYNYARTLEEIRLDYNAGFVVRFGPTSSCEEDPGSCMTKGLVAYYAMDEGSATTTYDNSDYKNHGYFQTTASSPKWAAGKKGGALSFDGANDYVLVPNSTSLIVSPGSWSLEAWAKPTLLDSDYHNIISKSGEQNYTLAIDTVNRFYVGFYNGSTWQIGSALTAATVNNWYHIAGVYNSSLNQLLIYINGILNATSSATGSPATSTGAASIGASSAGASRWFNGPIDEVRIYNRALSAEEVRYRYNRGGPVAQWKFDEGSGSAAHDSTENDNDGVLQNNMATTSWTTGKYGTALSFDGVDDYINTGNVYNGVKTISFWIKADNLSRGIIGLGNATTSVSSGTITTAGMTSSTIYVDGKVSSVIDTGWHHIVITTNTGINAADVNIGKGSSNYFDGILDDIKFYSYVRAPDEIRLDYNAGFVVRFGPTSSCDTDPGSCMTKGLVAYYAMDEGSATTTYDNSDYKNHGYFQTTASSPKWAAGKKGGALSFDGANDYVNCGNNANLQISGVISLEAWVNLKSLTVGAFQEIITKFGTYIGYYLILNSSGYFQGALLDGVDWGSSVADTIIPSTNTWYHLIYTYDGTTHRIYRDGVLRNSSDDTGGIADTTHNLTIGGPTSGRFANAIIDEVRIYDRVLSAEEVRYHYNRGGPVAYWKFDEGNGTTTYDGTENNNDGVLTLGSSGNTTTSNAWVQGQYGSALSFDGTDDYVEVPNDSSLEGMEALTVEAWIYPRNLNAQGGIAVKYHSGGAVYNLWSANSDTRIRGEIGTDVATYTIYSSSLSLNRWYHMILFYNGTELRLYLDGVLDDSASASGTINTSAGNLFVGSYTGFGYFNGLIDDVRIYNYARSADQMKQDYNQGAARFK